MDLLTELLRLRQLFHPEGDLRDSDMYERGWKNGSDWASQSPSLAIGPQDGVREFIREVGWSTIYSGTRCAKNRWSGPVNDPVNVEEIRGLAGFIDGALDALQRPATTVNRLAVPPA